jgi:hypothetical protein
MEYALKRLLDGKNMFSDPCLEYYAVRQQLQRIRNSGIFSMDKLHRLETWFAVVPT